MNRRGGNQNERDESRDIKKGLRPHRKIQNFPVFSIVLAAISVILTLYIPILTGQAVDCILVIPAR